MMTPLLSSFLLSSAHCSQGQPGMSCHLSTRIASYAPIEFSRGRGAARARARGEERDYAVAVRVQVSEDAVEIVLAPWQKVLGLLGNIRVPRTEIDDVTVVEDPIRAVIGTGLKAGLRVPWLYYLARTISLDQAWLVRRGVPALSFSVHSHPHLRRVVVSTPEAHALARQLSGG
jgi:hypothetical protein